MQQNKWEIITAIQKICRQVGAFQLKHFRAYAPGLGEEKKAKEYVSRIDIESEEMLKNGLHDICHEAGFYGEEGQRQRNYALEWLVDPLDGTTNYLSGFDQFTISVALVKQGQPQLGVIYRPTSAEFFTAVRSQGAWHDQNMLPRQTEHHLSQSLISTGFPYRSQDLFENFFSCAQDVLRASRGIRRTGSAALDFAYIAAGYLQGFWEADLQPYDLAAGLLMLSETGCPYSTLRQKPYNIFEDRMIIAGLPGVHAELCAIVDRHY
ncbi:inositol monophosphatase [candidate division KSB3 bacterium]|uniref:Inositol-1-monophosphatase n=1 Tax=candidate division KSB3 bacterium TaxID=2044937 RepID=A0A2G6E8K6_9BACT|nr:MAG: inositol monophosphatase [candidate division KSB3 bacterium]PIE30568.1 MAG: inositol monophosphatase [candidate division KSB3 bacterium]